MYDKVCFHLIGLRIVEEFEIHAIAIASACFHLIEIIWLTNLGLFKTDVTSRKKEKDTLMKKIHISDTSNSPICSSLYLSNHIEEDPNRVSPTDSVAKPKSVACELAHRF